MKSVQLKGKNSTKHLAVEYSIKVRYDDVQTAESLTTLIWVFLKPM